MLDLVGLGAAGKRKVRGYSLGMRQRLGLAAALIGDPRVLVLDEPANGLDPDGIRWLRGFFRHLAGEGRTVLVSSHQLNEVQEVADRVVILNHGQLVSAGSIAELTAGTESVRVRTPNPAPLGEAIAAGGGFAQHEDPQTLQVRGLTLEQVGHLAFTAGVELHELSAQQLRPRGPVLPAHRLSAARRGQPCSRARAAAQMIRLVRAEFVKLRTTQVWFWLLLAALAICVLVVLGSFLSSGRRQPRSTTSPTSSPRATTRRSRCSCSACSA